MFLYSIHFLNTEAPKVFGSICKECTRAFERCQEGRKTNRQDGRIAGHQDGSVEIRPQRDVVKRVGFLTAKMCPELRKGRINRVDNAELGDNHALKYQFLAIRFSLQIIPVVGFIA